MSIVWFARMGIIASMLAGAGTVGTRARQTETIVASGQLGGQVLDSALFRIDEFWMRVPPDTEFNRWLSEGLNRTVVITLNTDVSRFGDSPNVRILGGTLIHVTAPNPTAVSNDVTGRLPSGNLQAVHVLFLKDELTGSLGPITFETADFETAAKFSVYDGDHINIVIRID
jgi:hypothetical protein